VPWTGRGRLWGLREARWADLELTANWRQFLGDPASFLRHLT
jgi:hypothetical protein